MKGQRYAEELAANLKGRLLLIHGLLDEMPPANTYRLVEAFIKANKDFDLMLYPNKGHDYTNQDHITRLAWDYLVRHLQANEPPKDFKLTDTIYNDNDMDTYIAEEFIENS